MKKKVLIQSANFKRDYVAFSAVAIFFLIVITEITLAISIPAYLTRENVLAVQVRRLHLINSFDSLRYRVEKLSGIANVNGKKELQLIDWSMNQIGEYLREHSDDLTSNEIAQLQDIVNEFRKIAEKINEKKSYTADVSLTTNQYVNGILRKNMQQKLPVGK